MTSPTNQPSRRPPSSAAARATSAPAPGRLAEVRARLDLPLLRRAAGLLEGRHHSIFKGHGQDFDDLSLYSPGDDVGDIDWKSSARAGIPILRRFVRQSNLTTVIAADTGREMAALSSGHETKADVAVFLASVVSYLARDRGDRVALVAGDAGRLTQRPPRASTQDLELMLHVLAGAYGTDGPPSNLSAVLARVEAAYQRRSLVVVLTDEAHPTPLEAQQLRRLRERHEVVVLTVADADPVTIGSDGRAVADVASRHELPEFLRGRAALADAVETEQTQHRAANRAFFNRERILHTSAGAVDDAVAQLVALLGRRSIVHR